MQSSPFHTNKIFDGKFSMLNVPKSSKNSSWKLVKDVDDKTGSFKYTLVNNDLDTKVLETKLNLMKESETEANFEKEQEQLQEEENTTEEVSIVKQEENTANVQPFFNLEYNVENNNILVFDFEKFTAKTRNVVLSPFSNECLKVNSKDFQKLSENSRFLDYRKDYYTRINNIIFSIEGTASDTFSDVFVTFSLKFLNRTTNENIVYNYSTNKLTLKNNQGKIFQQFVGNVNSFIENSNSNLITYTPTIQIHNEDDSVADFNLYVKTNLKYEKVNVKDVNYNDIQFLPVDSLNYK